MDSMPWCLGHLVMQKQSANNVMLAHLTEWHIVVVVHVSSKAEVKVHSGKAHQVHRQATRAHLDDLCRRLAQSSCQGTTIAP